MRASMMIGWGGWGAALAMVAVCVPVGVEESRAERSPLPSAGAVESVPLHSTPMTITSARLTIHDAERRATFEGAVLVTQADLTLKADRVDVWTNDFPATTAGPVYGGSNVSRITATGHVEVSQGDRVVQADQAVYDQARQQVELTGNLSGHEGGYKVAGTRMVIFLLEHRSVIDKSRVVIPSQALSIPSHETGAQRGGP
jgi:lipopolysaccharide export system protein LptA